MNLFLDRGLADQYRGRFLMTQLGAVPTVDELPVEGTLLKIGSEFQGMNRADQDLLWQWCRQPGRSLLLLPPYKEGSIFYEIDWKIAFREQAPDSNGTPVTSMLTDETMFQIDGKDGEFDKSAGHQWSDFSINTRFIKQYSGSGVFAVTTLPLWSIALLDAAETTLSWINSLHQLAGSPAGKTDVADKSDERMNLTPQDFAIMVFVYGWAVSDADELKSALESQVMPISRIDTKTVKPLLRRLSSAGYLSNQGLSEKGLETLKSSAYWGYATSLQEEVA